MTRLLTIPDAVATRARLRPDKLGARDSRRALTYRQWHERASRLANALAGLGLDRGDRVAVLAYNRVEWLEIYVALARAGLVAVPINFRLVGPEILYILQHAEARAIVVQDSLAERLHGIRDQLDIPSERVDLLGDTTPPAGWSSYEAVVERAAATAPDVAVRPDDPWAMMYTSGTTGRPKGAARSHAASALLGLVSALDMGFTPDDVALLVMPLCHANSLFFASTFVGLGATCVVDDSASFDPERLLRTFAEHRVTFTSLVPTHYILMLALPEAVRRAYDVRSVNRLLISSAPARRDTKLAIMEAFANSRLFEMYGSTEAGWVTILRPDEQLTKLGSVGRELTGTGPVRLLEPFGQDIPDGEIGELYSWTPYAFDGYWRDPERTAQAFQGAWCSVGDLARRDADGFYHLVDRKSNMIISGGENVYPSEVEGVLSTHPDVQDVAVIGVPHEVWGEAVHAVVVPRAGAAVTGAELIQWCRERMAGYKRPRSVAFISEADMPRTATGTILHRVLRARHPTSSCSGLRDP
ncbi:MAG: AMP-binding protein [Chloroflexota bacterium]|nr:AMP-binding protein [Chloroflexota bacterium]